MAQILIVEDNTTMREGIVQILERMGHDARGAHSGRDGISMFEQSPADFVITDLKMEDIDGIEVLRRIKEASPEALVMLITAFGTIETAVEAMKLGAFDFITKPFPPDLLRLKVTQAIDLARVRAENRYFRTERAGGGGRELIGQSPAMQKIREQIGRVAPTDSSVLITGESGTGKELVAQAIHRQSPRSEKPFIKVDCSALAVGVLESELFGHERGAFTGATQRKLGRFELAHEGSIFLDEVGEIHPPTQLKLLRVLQDRCFERVGGNRTLKVDVRVISATNKDLQSEIRAGRFREDLFYRLHIVPIELPPLRERREDIGALIDHFFPRCLRKTGKNLTLTSEARGLLQAHKWPGNVRELENVIEQICVLATGPEIQGHDLPNGLKNSNDYVRLDLPGDDLPLNDALESLERQLILRALEKAQGVKTRTAQILGIKTSALYYKLEKYGIAAKEE